MTIKPRTNCAHAPPVGGIFPPPETERETVLEVLHQSPENFGAGRSRWTLALLQQLVPALMSYHSLSGVWRRLRRWRIARKRGRSHLSSPDPHYRVKLEAIAQVLRQARAFPEQVAALYGDETTLWRQPPIGLTYHEMGRGGQAQPRAERSYASNSKHRVVGTLDAVAGRVLFATGHKIGVQALTRFLVLLRTNYGPSKRLVLIWDNWPVHAHPQVVATAQAQGIELLWLPTYAPWTNPIEKLWRKLKEEVVAMHRYSEQWVELKQRMADFLQAYDRPAPDLLRYVGLLPD